MSESDGMEEAVEAGMRAAMMAAARIGEQLAKMREQDQREIQQAEEQRARQLQERFTASQAAARAQLEPVGREDWWDKATPEMIERAHETATAWKDYDPVAAEHAEQIRGQVQQCYGFDVNSPGASESEISDALSRTQQARQLAENERSNASAARSDEIVAAAAVAGANREDRARSMAGEPAYDSAERRRNLAASLTGNPDREAVNARLTADKHQGTHPSAAVQSKSGAAQTATMNKAPSKARAVEREGRTR